MWVKFLLIIPIIYIGTVLNNGTVRENCTETVQKGKTRKNNLYVIQKLKRGFSYKKGSVF